MNSPQATVCRASCLEPGFAGRGPTSNRSCGRCPKPSVMRGPTLMAKFGVILPLARLDHNVLLMGAEPEAAVDADGSVPELINGPLDQRAFPLQQSAPLSGVHAKVGRQLYARSSHGVEHKRIRTGIQKPPVVTDTSYQL